MKKCQTEFKLKVVKSFLDGNGGQFKPGAIHTARKQAGLPELRVHDLRHSFASFLVNAGRSLYEVQELLGTPTFAPPAGMHTSNVSA